MSMITFVGNMAFSRIETMSPSEGTPGRCYEPLSLNKYQKHYEAQQIKYLKKGTAKLGLQLVPSWTVSENAVSVGQRGPEWGWVRPVRDHHVHIFLSMIEPRRRQHLKILMPVSSIQFLLLKRKMQLLLERPEDKTL